MRAVAVLLVLAYHAGLPLVSGGFVGVDVFFVISGFLITGLILREVESTGRLRLGRFYARRIRRLLPATAVVLAATAALTMLLLPPLRWPSVAGDIAASATYVVNWRLAADSVDYLAAGDAPSPVQHFWSLAVEEQFYLLWPVLILALVWWRRRRRGGSVRRTLLAGLAVVAVPSFAWSVHLTAASPGAAYFVSTTRAWELAAGAAVAIGARRLERLPVWLAGALAGGGLAAVGWAALSYDAATAFPGAAALVPVLGTAAVIAAGVATPSGTVPGRLLGSAPLRVFAGGLASTLPTRLLGSAPLRWVGGLSYSLYLWHWPLLLAASALWGALSPSQGTLVVLAAFGPAWLTHRLVEAPIHHARALAVRPHRAFAVGVAATATALLAALVTVKAVPEYATADEAPGAAVLAPDPAGDPDGEPVDQVPAMTPDPIDVPEDNPDIYPDGCQQNAEDADLASCAYGDLDAGRVIALAGDSHAAQWQPALDVLGERYGWRIETYTKSSCGFFSVEVTTAAGAPYTSCRDWNEALLDRLTGPDKPELVVTSGSNSYRVWEDGRELGDDASADRLADGLRESWQAVRDAGVELVVLENTPWLDQDPAECVSAKPDRLTECAQPRADAVEKAGDEQRVAAGELGDVDVVDLNRAICPTDECPAVIGNVVVWRDDHHLTATYARSLASHLETQLRPYLAAARRSAA
ncbi:acyltransferase family protein [Jiangella sp. DSM 45060]|uniref:acyltransferase family protein n=1 Tax=Jiangella sp. DSM 45060 TaxID=1798224 RepID=UPI0035189D63